MSYNSFKEFLKYPKSATAISSSTKFKHCNYELSPKGKRWIHESENLQYELVELFEEI